MLSFWSNEIQTLSCIKILQHLYMGEFMDILLNILQLYYSLWSHQALYLTSATGFWRLLVTPGKCGKLKCVFPGSLKIFEKNCIPEMFWKSPGIYFMCYEIWSMVAWSDICLYNIFQFMSRSICNCMNNQFFHLTNVKLICVANNLLIYIHVKFIPV